MNRPLLCVLALAVVGGLARGVALDSVPPGLHPDEAVNASEARSIARTGASRDGRRAPLTVSMHGGASWTEAGYVWLAAPLSAFDLPPALAIRIPAALAGVLLIPGVFLLGRRLLGSQGPALFAAAIVAVEPYAVHYSRLGLRAALVPPLLTYGLLLTLRAFEAPKGRSALLRACAAGVLLSLALLAYTPARLFVPLLLGTLIVLASPRDLRAGVLVGPPLLAVLATLPWALSPEGGARLGSIAIPAHADGPLHAAWLLLKGYALHFSPRMLLWGSSSKGFWAEGVAPLLAIEAPLAAVGFAVAARRARRGVASAQLLVAWTLLYPLASSLTVPAPNPMRAIFAVPLVALLAGLGLRASPILLRAHLHPKAITRAAWGGLVISALAAGQSYFVRFPAAERRFWYAEHLPALDEALRRARVAEVSLDVRCSRLEAALVELAARDAPCRVEQFNQRAQVRVSLGPGQPWVATLTRELLVLRDADGVERWRRSLR